MGPADCLGAVKEVMTINGKMRITLRGGYTDTESPSCLGTDFSQERTVLADAVVQSVDNSDLSVLELRLVVPARQAEEMLVGMVTGAAELSIGNLSLANSD